MIEPLLFYKLMGKLTKWFLNSFGSHYDGADKNNSMSHDPHTFFLAFSLMVQSLRFIQTQISAQDSLKLSASRYPLDQQHRWEACVWMAAIHVQIWKFFPF